MLLNHTIILLDINWMTTSLEATRPAMFLVTCAHLWLQVNHLSDCRSVEVIVDSVQVESSPSVLSSVETVLGLGLLVLPGGVRRPSATESGRMKSLWAESSTFCVQATNLNAFFCCDNAGLYPCLFDHCAGRNATSLVCWLPACMGRLRRDGWDMSCVSREIQTLL